MQFAVEQAHFVRMEAKVSELLSPLGFVREGHQYDGPFGSHYVDYVLHERAYRLVADGREFCLRVEITDHYTASHFQNGWRDLLSLQYPSNAAGLDSCVERIGNAISRSLAGDA